MNYIDAINTLKKIEAKYNIMSIKYKGICVWPYLRCYIVDQLGYKKAQAPSASNALFILKSLFSYNPLVIRGKFDVWSYSGVITRKKIGSMYHHHAAGVLPYITDSILKLENPERTRPHYKKTEIPEKNIISNSWSIFLSRGLEFLLRYKSINIENSEILDKINEECGLSFDYKFRVRLLYAQKIATDILLWVGKKPKVVVMECPYDQMGYVWSFHCHDIPVVELQHGVINGNHYAYNFALHGGILAPDALCLYGDEEYNFISNRRIKFCPVVKKTGLFILDEADRCFVDDIFEEDRKIYSKVVVVAGQTGLEERLLSFIEETSKLTLDILYVYIPRRESDISTMRSNIRIVYNVNIYEYLKWCDVHCTVSSTTCLESQYFNKPNIFVELNDTARIYYGHVLNEINGSFFVGTPSECADKIRYCIDNSRFEFRNLFEKGSVELVKDVIGKYIK